MPPSLRRSLPSRKLPLRIETALLFIFLLFAGQLLLLHINVRGSSRRQHEIATATQHQPWLPRHDNAHHNNHTGKRHKHKKPWDPSVEGAVRAPVPLKVPFPIFSPSLPKSGTTSLWQYFQCGGHKASHQWIKKDNTTQQSGACIQANVAVGRPPFLGCGDYQIFTDAGYANYQLPVGSTCYYPSIDALEAMYAHYPNMTFVMVVRDTKSWYDSMAAWGDGSLLTRWKPCNATNLPGWDATAISFQAFYDWHTQHIRDFAAVHPSITYIEVPMEGSDTGARLEAAVGISQSCWGRCTPYSKFCARIPAK